MLRPRVLAGHLRSVRSVLAFLFQCVGRMPLVTNLDSDDEGLLELVDGQEIIRNRSHTVLDDVDTDSDGEDHGSNRAGNGVLTPSSSKLGTQGKGRLSNGAHRRMSMGSVATHGSMPEEYSFDHVGLDGRHTTTMYQPVSVSTTSGALTSGGQKVICEMDSVPRVYQNSDAGSKSSRDISVASLGTAPGYHAGKGPFISKGYGGAPIEDASIESGSILSPYHAGQGPYIKGSLAPEGSTSKLKKKKASRSDKKSTNPPTNVAVKKSDATAKRKSHQSETKKSSRSQKQSSGERSRRSRPKTSSIATQTEIIGSHIDEMQSKIESQEAELNETAKVENKRDSVANEAVYSPDLKKEGGEEEEDRASLLEQEVVEMKLQLAQAQADLQEAQLQIHRITKERDEALSMKDDADRACDDLRRAVEEMQDDSRRERLRNQMQGTSSRYVLQKRASSTPQSAESSLHGSKSGWHSSITSTGMFGGSSGYHHRGIYASSRWSMTSRNDSIGNLSGVLDVQNLLESDAEEPVGTRGKGGNLQSGPLKRDMAQQALLDGGNKAPENLERIGSDSEQEVHDDDPFATVYNKASSDDDKDSDKKSNGPFGGFGLMRRSLG